MASLTYQLKAWMFDNPGMRLTNAFTFEAQEDLIGLSLLPKSTIVLSELLPIQVGLNLHGYF